MASTRLIRQFAGLCLTLLSAQLAMAADDDADALDSTSELLSLSWDELTELKVSGLARQAQTVKDTPAAAFVISAEDIRRSGAASLPELLRMAPGMAVARVNSWNWGVSARGFNDLYANKLQVMIDGRSIYDPLISGVYWGQHIPLLQNIERIEVLRGPSGSLWGANAVNGAINIVTRSAADTEGGLLTAAGGTEERGFGGVRYGQKLSDSTYLRGSINALVRDASVDMAGLHNTHDTGNAETANFRLDSQLTERDQLMLEATATRYRLHGFLTGVSSATPPYWRQDDFGKDGVSGSLQGNWTHQFDGERELRVNMAFTQTDWQMATNRMSRSHYNLDIQHSQPLFGNHHLLWGLNYQIIDDRFDNTLTLGFEPDRFTQHNIGLFAQDNIDLLDNLQLTLGNRVENFTYTGWETEPNARLIWTPHKNHRLWAGVSRAVALPNRAQQSIRLFLPVPGQQSLFFLADANQDMRTENVVAYELGWRWQVNSRLDLDSTVFYNIYDRIQGVKASGFTANAQAPGFPLPILDLSVGNYRQMKSYGLELAANYRVSHDWRLQASYTGIRFDNDADSRQPWFLDPLAEEKVNPQHSLSLRSMLDLTDDIELDAWARYVDRISVNQVRIPDYISLDLRLGWRPAKNLELSLVGQNLLDGQRPEFNDVVYIPVSSQIQRGYFAQLSWRF
ncbi:TonB-dependent receptor plug domain-containing protein [Methylomonas koyamae]|uniref:TonB-dependent receptor plug domain-containing protein n=1 Tax=Methylomonas koyamae TaxID=702114 RepID=UPI00112C9AFC|nr:TonB-dependent receptor [Methylomonas koyamae]TPQ25606.1 TonB-dependent receptor [Methylomonas koyamae]